MRLIYLKPCAVPVCSSATPGVGGQTQLLQRLHHLIPRRVDRGSVLERVHGPRFYFRVAKLGSRQVALGTVTVVTTERQVAVASRATTALRSQVVQFKRPVLLA